jgi:hypothetical protein
LTGEVGGVPRPLEGGFSFAHRVDVG